MSQRFTKSDAHAWLAARQTEWTRELIELANINSGSSHRAGLAEMAQRLEVWDGMDGVHCERLPLPPRQVVLDDGVECAIETEGALCWRVRPECERRVLLGIHYDTVYPPHHQSQQCRLVSEDKLIGPGVADAKGGIVVVRAALQALERFRLADNIGWTLLLTPDEELGSPSSAHLWSEQAADHDFGLLLEPALPSGALIATRKGSGNFVVVVRGRAAHAGRDFEQGRNAVALASRLAVNLDELNGQQRDTTINVGRVSGGGPVNVVPDLAVVHFNVRVPDVESQHWFAQRLSDVLALADEAEGFAVAVHGGFSAPPKVMTHAQRVLMNAVEHAHAELGMHVHWEASGGVCDGNRLAAAGLPNIDTLGPIGGSIHSADEWVDLSSIPRKAQVLVEILNNFERGLASELTRQRSIDTR